MVKVVYPNDHSIIDGERNVSMHHLPSVSWVAGQGGLWEDTDWLAQWTQIAQESCTPRSCVFKQISEPESYNHTLRKNTKKTLNNKKIATSVSDRTPADMEWVRPITTVYPIRGRFNTMTIQRGTQWEHSSGIYIKTTRMAATDMSHVLLFWLGDILAVAH